MNNENSDFLVCLFVHKITNKRLEKDICAARVKEFTKKEESLSKYTFEPDVLVFYSPFKVKEEITNKTSSY